MRIYVIQAKDAANKSKGIYFTKTKKEARVRADRLKKQGLKATIEHKMISLASKRQLGIIEALMHFTEELRDRDPDNAGSTP